MGGRGDERSLNNLGNGFLVHVGGDVLAGSGFDKRFLIEFGRLSKGIWEAERKRKRKRKRKWKDFF